MTDNKENNHNLNSIITDQLYEEAMKTAVRQCAESTIGRNRITPLIELAMQRVFLEGASFAVMRLEESVMKRFDEYAEKLKTEVKEIMDMVSAPQEAPDDKEIQ